MIKLELELELGVLLPPRYQQRAREKHRKETGVGTGGWVMMSMNLGLKVGFSCRAI